MPQSEPIISAIIQKDIFYYCWNRDALRFSAVLAEEKLYFMVFIRNEQHLGPKIALKKIKILKFSLMAQIKGH